MGYFSPASSNPTGSMAAMLADAQKLPDSTLAEVLAGKSQAVPQFAAMLAAQSRQQLRTAQNAAAAGKTPPTIKDQLAASEAQAAAPQGLAALAPQQAQPAPQQQQMASTHPAQGGLDQLPADNMKNMAGGGIVAFEEGGDVIKAKASIDQRNAALEALKAMTEPPKDFVGSMTEWYKTPQYKEQASAYNLAKNAVRENNPIYNQLGTYNPYQTATSSGMTKTKPIPDSMTQSIDESIVQNTNPSISNPLNPDSPNNDGTKYNAPPPGINTIKTDTSQPNTAQPPADAKPAEATGLSFEDFLKKHSTDNLGGIQALMDKYGQEHADEQSRTGGRALMSIGEGLLKNPTLAGGVAEGSRGVQGILDAQQKANADFNKFNVMGQIDLAKAKDAAEKGDMQSALAYQKNAQDANYQKGIIEHYAADLKAKQPLINAQANLYNQRASGAVAGAGLDLRAHMAAETSVNNQMKDFLKTPDGRKLAKDPTQLAAYRQNLYTTAYGNLVGKPYTPQSLQLNKLPKDVDGVLDLTE